MNHLSKRGWKVQREGRNEGKLLGGEHVTTLGPLQFE
jgi:hypothetical protein